MVTAEQRAAIAAKADLLAGRELGARGAALTELACDAALSWCCREDIPAAMEQAVAALVLALDAGGDGPVKSIQRGDTAVTYAVDGGGLGPAAARLAPWRRLGGLREG